MPIQVALVTEHFGALLTPKQDLLGVVVHVVVQITLRSEGFFTLFAWKRPFFAALGKHMSGQYLFPCKCFTALFAHVRFFVIVNDLYMLL